ncbi:MAG: SpoIIE family protein phosphatase [Spirochaetaceae bacterium]|jgi:serine phosphatase RsbU (regulator of sigma subunit)|nr:SpoIIE family protein phosphatase [Spirochaetaceae bacterium]
MRNKIFPVLFLGLLGSISLGAQELYWEEPRLFANRNGSFPVSAYQGNLSVVAWQETAKTASGGQIKVSLAVKQGRGPWIPRNEVASYTYSGTEPAILSTVIDSRGRILIAAAASGTETDILISSDLGETFDRYQLELGSESSVAPRIFTRSDGGYILFVTRGTTRDGLSLYYSRSDDGISWTHFQPFVTESGRNFNFLPSYISFNGRDYVVYQSRVTGLTEVGPTFQLFLKSSRDNGISWSQSVRITGFRDFLVPDANPDEFDNQRAHLSVQQGRLFTVWERRYQNQAPQIYGTYINSDGSIAGAPSKVNSDDAYCNNPIAFTLRGNTVVVWFDNSQGANRIMMARERDLQWSRGTDLSRGIGGDASFGRPVIVGDTLTIFWQSSRQGQDRIYSLSPDTSVGQPQLLTRNFVSGRRTRNSTAQISWSAPRTSLNIQGYAWSWSEDAGEDPPREIMSVLPPVSLEMTTDTDGTWYFSLIAQDYSGAWSDPVRVTFIRDTTPPPAARIIVPETDEEGFLVSNTFTMRWNTPPASDITGYTWNLEYLGPASILEGTGEDLNRSAGERFGGISLPPRAVLGPGTAASFTNEDNGLWAFTVSAVDEVGNIGIPSRYFFKTNKYISRTYVTYADARQDEAGQLVMRIIGRGFADGGLVTRILLDQDGLEPYDREYRLDGGGYRVASDREIGYLLVNDISPGLYRILMEHPLRGLYVSPPLITVDRTGTIKFGDYSQTWQPSWVLRQGRKFPFDVSYAVLGAILAFCVLGFLASLRGIGSVVAESAAIRMETIALITGDIMPSEKKKRMIKIKKRGGGLRLKMASFTIALVALVVVMISSPLYVMMGRTQESTLLQGLRDRATVLLEGIATSARAYMPSNNLLELGYLPSQSSAIPEARYVTITGYGKEDVFYNHVLATNDPDIESKLDSPLELGISRLTDVLTPRVGNIAQELNDRAREAVGELSASITLLNREAQELLERPSLTPEENERVNVIALTTQSYQSQVSERLAEISREIGSEPVFSTVSLRENTSNTYLFFKPVLYRQSSDDMYYRGLIRLEVTIDSIITQVRDGQWALLRIILIIALAAIAIGTIGALVLSSLIIRPITRLVSHVERIRDTEDKTKLEGVDIEIKTKDEIAVLGRTINDMTHGLVKAAAAAADLSLGKEIQKKFIPLDLNRDGNKVTTGFKDTKNVQFFGYYEGAKGVSGDYFDYQDLDGRYFAIIKCDVAGKGIPAALIMIQVATMFISFFRRWKPTEKGFHIEDLVYQINDFLETLGFKGRFAAFTLCLFDSQTGIVRFCNAGDNIVHWYDASERRMKTVTLRETPATGVLPNFLVESKGGYPVQTLTIDHGDILFLFTDGIEEAKRRFRNADFVEILCEEGEKDTPHATHTVGQGDEEMGPDRVEAIINAVMNREAYVLHKYHNPEGENRDLSFDFTNCEGKVEEAIMAMVSVEKIFRIYKDSRATAENQVLVDKKVDAFLRKHFQQYRNYCYDTRETPGNDEYMYYTHLKEDEQYDDLTILGVNRK